MPTRNQAAQNSQSDRGSGRVPTEDAGAENSALPESKSARTRKLYVLRHMSGRSRSSTTKRRKPTLARPFTAQTAPSAYQQKLLALLTKVTLNVDERVGTPEDIAARMLAAIPHSSTWDAAAGPFYDTAGLVRWLDVSRQRIHQLAKHGDILSVLTGDGKSTLYPAWQFGPQGELLPGLKQVVDVLKPALASSWTIASWLNADTEDSDSPASLLRAGELDSVLSEARETAWQFAQ